MSDWDWIGARRKRWCWRTWSFEFGRWHFKTDCMGNTLESKWIFDMDRPWVW